MTYPQDAHRYALSTDVMQMTSSLLSQDLQEYVDSLPATRQKGSPERMWTKIHPSPVVFQCSKCKEYLPVTNFYPVRGANPARKDVLGAKRNSRCRDCCMNTYFDSDPRRKLLYSAKGRAREKGLEFSITVDDIVIPEYCPVLGIKLQASVRTGRLSIDKLWFSPTIDRLDNAEGYTPDNIRVISHRANSLKNNATLEELKQIVEYMERELKVKHDNKPLAENAHTYPTARITS
jgi:hypothetical protein